MELLNSGRINFLSETTLNDMSGGMNDEDMLLGND
jgi:hypothetical protein